MGFKTCYVKAFTETWEKLLNCNWQTYNIDSKTNMATMVKYTDPKHTEKPTLNPA